MLQSKSNFLCKPQQKCEEFCGSALRCHWRKCYYQTQIYEESFFVGNPFEGPGWTGGTCPGTISLAHVLRGSCARGSFGQTRFSHKTLNSGFPGQKKQKASILRPIDTPELTILHSTCHITICIYSMVIWYVLRSPLRPLARPCIFDASISCSQNPICHEEVTERPGFFINPHIYIYICK